MVYIVWKDNSPCHYISECWTLGRFAVVVLLWMCVDEKQVKRISFDVQVLIEETVLAQYFVL